MLVSDAKGKILRLLNDPGKKIFTDDLLNDAISQAIDAILPWAWMPSVSTLTGDGNTQLWPLPDDCYAVLGVIQKDVDITARTWLPQILVGKYDYQPSFNAWILFPSGSIAFDDAPQSNQEVDVYYAAIWPKPVSDADTLSVPGSTLGGIIYYACHYALITKSVAAAEIRPYNTRLDSGTPDENPAQRESDHFYKLFVAWMDKLPLQGKGVPVA